MINSNLPNIINNNHKIRYYCLYYISQFTNSFK